MSDVVDRKRMIEDKIMKRDENALRGLGLVREQVWDFLMHEKGYVEGDIEVDRRFEISIDDVRTTISVDYLITIFGRRFMVIKCTPGTLESRERHLVSFARVVDSYQIPLAVVTDGAQARIMDAISGRLAGEDLTSIPGRSMAIEFVQSMEFKPYPHDKMEREKRILLAFEAIKCTEESCE
jgi:Type I restriction enzyme R protein N terminus (HSDR_N)